MRDRGAVGRHSRRKGRTFERLVVRLLRARGLDAQRGWWQSRGGHLVPDVILDGFWLELGHGDRMDGALKLDQAVENERLHAERDSAARRIPVAVTRRTGSRSLEATMRHHDLLRVLGLESSESERQYPALVVALGFEDWLEAARRFIEMEQRA